MGSKGLWLAFWAVIPVAIVIIAIVTGVYLWPNFIPAIVGLAVAYILLVISQLAPRRADRGFLGLPILGAATVLFLVSAVFNGIVVWIVWPLWVLIVVVNVVLVAVFLLLVIPMMLSNDQAQAGIERRAAQVQIQSGLRAQVRALKLSTSDPALSKIIDRLEEEVRYAPTASTASSAPFDHVISAGLDALPSLLASGDKDAATATLNRLIAAVKERTNALKTGR